MKNYIKKVSYAFACTLYNVLQLKFIERKILLNFVLRRFFFFDRIFEIYKEYSKEFVLKQ